MPSIHVAIALWIAFVVRSYLPRLKVVAFAWFALILVGSVLLGWHYAVDGVVACVISLLAWMFTGRSMGKMTNTPPVQTYRGHQVSIQHGHR